MNTLSECFLPRFPAGFLVPVVAASLLVMVPGTLSAAEAQPTAPARRAPQGSVGLSRTVVGWGVTFRLRAPKATDVKVSGQFGKDATMVRDTNGVWSVTVPSVPAGVHEYHFVVDGLSTLDPQNSAVKPQRWPG